MDNEKRGILDSGATSADEIRRYLQQSNEGIENSEDEESEKLDEIAGEELASHNNTVTIIVIAFVMIFFGTVFTALTNYQDFSEGEGFTWKRFTSGSFFGEVEKKFNKSLPLQDYLHNAESAIKYCYGTGNKTDYIDIEAKRLADDPYSMHEVNEYTPLSDSQGEYNPVFDNGDSDDGRMTSVVTTDNHKNKKLSGIKITTPYYVETNPDESYKTTELDLHAPDVSHTTTEVPMDITPFTTAETTETETEAPQESEEGSDTETTAESSETETTTESQTETQTQAQTTGGNFVIAVPGA